LSLDQNTLIADDIGLFKFPVLSDINVSVDMLYNVLNPGIYIVCMHYITDEEIDFKNVVVIDNIDLGSSVKAIEFDFGYFVLNKSEEPSNTNSLMFTIMKIEVEGEDISLTPEAFTFMPLFLAPDVVIQGNF
jgi:hypothetical protein